MTAIVRRHPGQHALDDRAALVDDEPRLDPRSRRSATASLAARPDTSSLQPNESQTSRPGATPSAMRSSTA